MDLQTRLVVVTGGASGIGQALGVAAHQAATRVILADLTEKAAQEAAIGGVGKRCDVADEAQRAGLIGWVEAEIGPLGLRCGNAGGSRAWPSSGARIILVRVDFPHRPAILPARCSSPRNAPP